MSMKILITGASKGIGAELAFQLAEGKHKLILLARSEDALKRVCDKCNEKAGAKIAFPIVYDLRNLLVDGRDFIKSLDDCSAELDILVNNAAALIKKPFTEITLAESKEVFDANYFAVEQLIRLCLPRLKKSSDASIINVTSMAAVQGSSKFPGLSAYSASKGALATLTECLAEEFKEYGIYVNALAFGSVNTEMLAEAFPGFNAKTSPPEMGSFFKWFVEDGWRRFNGKMLQVSDSTP